MNQSSTISIIMCVYNGERFLVEQLESVRNQAYKPHEVIIHDDCSTDSSVKLIKEFITKYNLESIWRIKINPSRKGWRLNFYDAIAECNGDYIFFCDHDDIWHQDKISIMIDAMKKNPNIFVLNGLFETIDSTGKPVNIMNWTANNVYNRKVIKSGFGDVVYHWKQRIGCTMAIKKTVKEQLKYFECNEYFAHDFWALNIGVFLGGCYYINYPVIKYRVHGNNATAGNTVTGNTVKVFNRTERIQRLEDKINCLEYLYGGIKLMDRTVIDKNEYSNFLKTIDYYKFRLSSIKDSKISNVFGLFSYIKIYFKYLSFKEFIIDVLEALNLRDHFIIVKYSFKKATGKKS